MQEIIGTTIKMTRGDTLITFVGMKRGEDDYVPQVGDSLRFALKSPKMNSKKTEYADAEPLLEKDIPIDTQLLRLDPEDTKPLGFGDYVYDIQITFADGKVDTFISEAKLTLLPEVD